MQETPHLPLCKEIKQRNLTPTILFEHLRLCKSHQNNDNFSTTNFLLLKIYCKTQIRSWVSMNLIPWRNPQTKRDRFSSHSERNLLEQQITQNQIQTTRLVRNMNLLTNLRNNLEICWLKSNPKIGKWVLRLWIKLGES